MTWRGPSAAVSILGVTLIAWGCQPEALAPAVGAEASAAAPGTAASGGNGPAVAGSTAGVSEDCSLQTPAPRRLWRLTPSQYDSTLTDLLGIQSHYGAGFPADDIGVGFANAADALLMSPLLADKLQSAAEDSASHIELRQLVPCAGAGADDTCLRELVASFGKRAFRRPLRLAEIDTYFELGKQASGFESGARLIVSAMLQSPSFLYRSELGQPSASTPGVYELDDYEIASELSYLLWHTMPDALLFQAAERGELRDPTQRRTQLERMLQSERVRPVVRKFVFDWLGLSTIKTVPKDTASYPELTADVRDAMVQEAERFVDSVMFGVDAQHDGSIRALLNADAARTVEALESFYASPGQRRGILTLGGVLLTHSRSNDSSPIHRGKLVREKLLCQPLPPPPPGLDLQPPGLDPTKTARQRYAEHSSNAFCGNCHKLMDPIGLAFEHYDGVGRYRADDHGLPIDPSGEIVPNENQRQVNTDADGPFANSDELIDLLANSRDVQRCYALEWFRFAYGEGKTERDGESYPSCQARRFQAAIDSANGGGSLGEIFAALTQSAWFLARSGQPEPVGADEPSHEDALPSEQPAASDPQTPVGLQVERTVDNDWGMGYCNTYQLTNTGAEPITWSVPLDVRGMLNNHWECNVSGDSGAVVFTGVDHNKTIAPGGVAQFGFCGVVN